MLEEWLDSATAAKAQYVWSPEYIDALVLRDRDAIGDASLEERIYVQQDANWNVTALVDAAGNVLERYIKDPYGKVMVLAPTWADRGATLFAWVYLHQGGRFESLSATYHFRNRDLSSALGRWLQRDPIEFRGGSNNLYIYLENRVTTLVDPFGTTPAYETMYIDNAEKIACASTYGAPVCARAKELADDALSAAKNRFPAVQLHNGPGDAWRHCYWSCLMRQDRKLKPYYKDSGDLSGVSVYKVDPAEGIGSLHESFGKKAGQPDEEAAMDLHNNKVGLKIGEDREADCTEHCCKALDNGMLKVLKG